MKVLVVEDSKTMRMIIKHLLDDIGVTDVEEAANGMEALTALVNTRFDLIIMDVHMPEMDGVELLDKIKASTHDETPLIVVTSDSDHRTIDKMRDAGASAYVTKPFTKEKLATTIKLVCGT